MAAPQVEEDLRQHHGRNSSRSTLRDIADVVASIAQSKEEKWELDQAVPGNNRIASLEKLIKARTYFKNHWHQMIYPEARDKNLPIGSGVTEAACKSLVKQRMYRSGMRWKEQGASMLLTLRALVCTPGQWDAFWSKMNRYGFPVAHNLVPVH